MTIILPNILSLLQHIGALRKEPESYRPKSCPGCRHATVWCHGCYTRKADESKTLPTSMHHVYPAAPHHVNGF